MKYEEVFKKVLNKYKSMSKQELCSHLAINGIYNELAKNDDKGIVIVWDPNSNSEKIGFSISENCTEIASLEASSFLYSFVFDPNPKKGLSNADILEGVA
ncbi:MAG: hypothetical protein VB122_04105 [Erysipelotrichales bacterium]|nr:hypothetical protein [Erysipelotrichales bacterium]